MNSKIICFDIDCAICKTVGNQYDNSKLNKKVINLINIYTKFFLI